MAKPTKYYVDPSLSSDTGDGSLSTPWGVASGSVIQHALDTISADTTDGDEINVKTGAYDELTDELDYSTYYSGHTPTMATPIIIRGYNSVAWDRGVGQLKADGTHPICADSGMDAAMFIDMEIDCNGVNTAVFNMDNFIYFMRCEIHNTPSTAVLVDAAGAAFQCYFHNIGISGFKGYGGRVLNCRFEDGPDYQFNYGIYFTASGDNIVSRNIISVSGAGTGIALSAMGWATGNIVWSDGGTGAAIYYEASTDGLIQDNVVANFSGVGGRGLDTELSVGMASSERNYVYNCTLAAVDGDFYDYGNNNLLSADPFVDAANGDFNINNAAGGGAVLRAAHVLYP